MMGRRCDASQSYNITLHHLPEIFVFDLHPASWNPGRIFLVTDAEKAISRDCGNLQGLMSAREPGACS